MPDVDNETEMDPLSAIGATKALVTTANTAAKNTLIQALLMPTAKVYGEHWAEQHKQRLKAEAAAKRQANAEAHLKAVQPLLSSDFHPDPEMTEEWFDGAQGVDPVDDELSEAWRATLLAIGSGNPFRQRMLKVVKEMSADEARAFVSLARRQPSSIWAAMMSTGPGVFQPLALAEYRSRLEGLGLIRSRWDVIGGPQGRLTIITVGMMFAGVMAVRFIAATPPYVRGLTAETIDGLMPLLLVSITLMGLAFLARALTNISLTTFGLELAAAIARIRSSAHGASPVDMGTSTKDDGPDQNKPQPAAKKSKTKRKAKPVAE